MYSCFSKNAQNELFITINVLISLILQNCTICTFQCLPLNDPEYHLVNFCIFSMVQIYVRIAFNSINNTTLVSPVFLLFSFAGTVAQVKLRPYIFSSSRKLMSQWTFKFIFTGCGISYICFARTCQSDRGCASTGLLNIASRRLVYVFL